MCPDRPLNHYWLCWRRSWLKLTSGRKIGGHCWERLQISVPHPLKMQCLKLPPPTFSFLSLSLSRPSGVTKLELGWDGEHLGCWSSGDYEKFHLLGCGAVWYRVSRPVFLGACHLHLWALGASWASREPWGPSRLGGSLLAGVSTAPDFLSEGMAGRLKYREGFCSVLTLLRNEKKKWNTCRIGIATLPYSKLLCKKLSWKVILEQLQSCTWTKWQHLMVHI
jgi:hypothetical protein